MSYELSLPFTFNLCPLAFFIIPISAFRIPTSEFNTFRLPNSNDSQLPSSSSRVPPRFSVVNYILVPFPFNPKSQIRHQIFPLPHSDFRIHIIPTFSSRQEPPEAIGKCLFSLFSACFRGGATRSLPYLSCSPAPHRTGQAAFPHPALRFVIQ